MPVGLLVHPCKYFQLGVEVENKTLSLGLDLIRSKKALSSTWEKVKTRDLELILEMLSIQIYIYISTWHERTISSD